MVCDQNSSQTNNYWLAKVYIHQFNESGFKSSALGGEDLAHQQVSLLAEITEGAGKEYSYASAVLHKVNLFQLPISLICYCVL